MPDNEPEDSRSDSEIEPAEKNSRVQREWLTPTVAQKYLGVSRATLYRLMDTAMLKFFVLKGVQKRRIRKEDWDALFEEGTTAAEKGTEKPKAKRKGKRKVAR